MKTKPRGKETRNEAHVSSCQIGNTLGKIHPNVIFTLSEVWTITGWKHLGCYGIAWELRENNLRNGYNKSANRYVGVEFTKKL